MTVEEFIYHPKTMVILRITAVIVFITVVISLWFNYNNNHDDNLWYAATSKNTVKSYKNYRAKSPRGKYREIALGEIKRIRKDRRAYANALAAKNVSAIKDYIGSCFKTGCENIKNAQKRLSKFEKLNRDFNYHIKVKNLSAGEKGFALDDIAKLGKLFPRDENIVKWRQEVASQYLKLAELEENNENFEKAQIYRAKADEVLNHKRKNKLKKSGRVRITLDGELLPEPPIKERQAPKPDPEFKLKQAMLSGDIAYLAKYLQDCGENCARKHEVAGKLNTYRDLSSKFSENIANNRLTVGEDNAVGNLASLKQIFPAAGMHSAWSDKIAAKFMALMQEAKNNKNFQKERLYHARGYEFMSAQMRAEFTKKEQDEVRAADVYELEEYINNCVPPCAGLDIAQEKISRYQSIKKAFETHLANDRLSKGDDSALTELAKLTRLFPGTLSVNDWRLKIGSKYKTLALEAAAIGDEKTMNLYNRKAADFGVTANVRLAPEKLAEKEKLLRALQSGDIKVLETYIAECASFCPYKTAAAEKIKVFYELKARFHQVLADDRIIIEENNVNSLVKELKTAFPQFKGTEWSQKISDRLFELAAQEVDQGNLSKALEYRKKALEFGDPPAGFLTVAQLQQAMHSGDILKLENHLEFCLQNCEEIKQKISRRQQIATEFSNYMADDRLTLAANSAKTRLNTLQAEFPDSPLIKEWHNKISDRLYVLAMEAKKRGDNKNAANLLDRAIPFVDESRRVKYRQEAKLQRKLANRLNARAIARAPYPEMVYIPGKVFTIGGKYRSSKPARKIKIRPFKISRTEVTFKQFKKFARARRIRLNTGGRGKETHPAVYVSWRHAVAYTKWLSRKTGRKYSLPSEVQWEYAASGIAILDGKGNLDTSLICKYANGADKGAGRQSSWKNYKCRDGYSSGTAPVASFNPNNFGLYDMQGNVWEWTMDCWHKNYRGAPKKDRAWTYGSSCSRAAIRGGSYLSSTEKMNPKYRFYGNKKSKFSYVGFRVVEII